MSSALLALMLTTSVAVAAPAGASPGYDAGPTPSPAVPQPTSAPLLNWGSCARFVKSTKDLPGAQCGTVSVPVDYANPAGAQAQLAVIRIPATGPRIGALMVNPGGPGASAVDMVASMGPDLAGTEVSRRFDLVGFDPRGVGHSTPGVRCRTDAEFDAYRREPMVDYSPAGVAHIEQIYRQIARAASPATARRSSRTSGPLLRHGIWMWSARRSATTRSTTWATATAPSWALPTSSASVTTSGRWCSTARSTPASARSTS